MNFLIPVLGYLATCLLALSLLVNNDLKFRWLNSFGCLVFIIYGLFIGALPVVFTNALLLVINVYYLIRIFRRSEAFDIVPFQWDDPLVKKFLAFYKNDLQGYFPDFSIPQQPESLRFMVLRDMNIANLFSATVTTPGKAVVALNYTIPRYRDYKVGKYIFEKENSYVRQQHINQLVYEQVSNKDHLHFLKVMGFEADEKGRYQLNLERSAL